MKGGGSAVLLLHGAWSGWESNVALVALLGTVAFRGVEVRQR